MLTRKLSRFFVYTLSRSNGRVFYVGKGTQLKRMNEHENEARRGRDSHKCRIIRKIWAAGQDVIKEIVFWTDDEQSAFAKEAELIAIYGKKNLANHTDGGEGMAGHSPSDVTRAKLSAHSLGNKHRVGTHHTKEWRANASKQRMGHPVSDSTRAKISQAAMGNSRAKGCVRSEEYKEKLRVASTGRYHTTGTIEKMRQSHAGKALPLEQRLKIADALRRAYAEGRRRRA